VWFERYAEPFKDFRLPASDAERKELATQIGRDGWRLWQALMADDTVSVLRQIEAVETLRQIWVQQFYLDEAQVNWREKGNLPPAERILVSPFDRDARYAYKRGTKWTGYKVHLTETCEPESLNLITHVHTAPAPEHDVHVTEMVQSDLLSQQRQPARHLADLAYVSGDTLVDSQQRGIDLFGPVREDHSRHAKQQTGYAVADFHFDWDNQLATCPKGISSTVWQSFTRSNGKDAIRIRFSQRDCRLCPACEVCCPPKKAARSLVLSPRPQFEAIQAARERQHTPEFRRDYAIRQGIESTIQFAANVLDARRTRYCGLDKVHLQSLVTATATNLRRVAAYLAPYSPAPRRGSHFLALAA
jgi:transposase